MPSSTGHVSILTNTPGKIQIQTKNRSPSHSLHSSTDLKRDDNDTTSIREKLQVSFLFEMISDFI